MIPVTIHLSLPTFNRLEALARSHGMSMRELIAAGLEQKPRGRVAGNIPTANRSGNRWLSADEWQELYRLRAAGWTVPQLAVKFGCASSTIYKHFQKRTKK